MSGDPRCGHRKRLTGKKYEASARGRSQVTGGKGLQESKIGPRELCLSSPRAANVGEELGLER